MRSPLLFRADSLLPTLSRRWIVRAAQRNASRELSNHLHRALDPRATCTPPEAVRPQLAPINLTGYQSTGVKAAGVMRCSSASAKLSILLLAPLESYNLIDVNAKKAKRTREL
jgi:hypothetical protein